MSVTPLSWRARRIDGTPWQGIRFLTIEIDEGAEFPAVVTAHLNQPATGLTADDVRIEGGRRVPPPDHEVAIGEPGQDPSTIVVRFRGYGDHSSYAVTLLDGGSAPLHPFFATAEFRFTIDCDGGDCRDPVGAAGRPPVQAPAVDLLTKDFNGFVRLLAEWVKVRNPRMTDLSPASFERMMLDVLAWSGDMLSYHQDRVANEGFVDTARQRFSMRQHGILNGFRIHDGAAARTVLAFDVGASGFVPEGLQVGMRTSADEQPVVFTAVRRTRVRTANDSTELRLAAFPDAYDAELPADATQMLLWGHGAELAPGDRLAFDQGSFSQIVTLTAVRRRTAPGWVAHPEQSFAPGDPDAEVTELRWREPLARAVRPWADPPLRLHGNLVDAVHGIPRRAVAGGATGKQDVPLSFGRRGAVVVRGSGDTRLLRALRVPEWPVVHDDDGSGGSRPAVEVAVSGTPWARVEHLHGSRSFDLHYTAAADEDGAVWIGFGDGVTGREVRMNADGSPGVQVEVRYRVGEAATGNVARGTLVEIVRPAPTTDEQAALEALGAVTVTNVVPATGGRPPDSIDRLREAVPASLRHGPLQRAVALSDYAVAAMQVPGVGRAVARPLGGLFNTVMVLVDPEGGEELDDDLRARLHAHIDRLRMTGREHVVLPAEYVPLDVELVLCVEPGFPRHTVRDRVLAELRPGTRDRPGWFHPDRLSFGDAVRLGDLLALVQGIPGVRSVRAAKFRPLFDHDPPPVRDIVRLGGTRVARLDADPSFPENGVLVVRVVGLDAPAETLPTGRAWRVTAVARRSGGAPQSRIVAIGGTHPGGAAWRMTTEEAVEAIESGRAFYVERPTGDRVAIMVAHTGGGDAYLRTEADGDEPNNLLALPELPDE